MRGKRIFLTGASGNVGMPVMEALLEGGYDVSALVRRRLDGAGAFRPVFGSLEELSNVATEVARCDGIIHLASPRSDMRGNVLREDITGTGNLLDAWSKGNFVYASSQTVYGVPKDALSEEVPHSPTCWYDLGKVCNEHQIAMTPRGNGRDAAVSLRLGLVFGAGDRRHDRQFLSTIFERIILGQAMLFDSEEGLETFGSSFIGESDLARAIVAAMDMRDSGPFNVAGGFCTWRSLFDAIDRHAGIKARIVVRAGSQPREGEFPMPQSMSRMDTHAFDSRTGFTPRQSLDDLVEAFASHESRDALI
jgi:nucleoside-diphosphate-sugar epimerase